MLGADTAAVTRHFVEHFGGDRLAVLRHEVGRLARGTRQVVMQIAVAEMPEDEGTHLRAHAPHARFGARHEIRNRFDGQRNVML